MLTDFETFRIRREIKLSNTVAGNALNRRKVSAGNVVCSNVGAGVNCGAMVKPARIGRCDMWRSYAA